MARWSEPEASGEFSVALAQRPDGLSTGQIGIPSPGRRLDSTAAVTGLRITDAGLDALGDYEELPTGQALLEHWLRKLGRIWSWSDPEGDRGDLPGFNAGRTGRPGGRSVRTSAAHSIRISAGCVLLN